MSLRPHHPKLLTFPLSGVMLTLMRKASGSQMMQREIEWRDLNLGAPVSEPGNYPVESLGLVAVSQEHIDYVRENGEGWGFVVRKQPEDAIWRITRIVRGL